MVGHSYVVKNTFVELSHQSQDGLDWNHQQHSASETTAQDESQSLCSSPPTPVEQVECMPEADLIAPGKGSSPFSLAVLATPSPFLYPATPLELPPDYDGVCGMLLPPAFEGDGMVPYEMMGFDTMGMPFPGVPPMMYDASTDMYVPCGWGTMDFEGTSGMDTSFLQLDGEGGEGLPEAAGFEAAVPSDTLQAGGEEEAMAVAAQEPQVQLPPAADEGAWSAGEAAAPSAGEEAGSWSQPEGSPKSFGGACQLHTSSGDSGSSSSIWSGAGTTVMLRNIPNKYTRDMLVAQLNEQLRGMFDFVYLPIDFKNRCNVGYCFINFRSIEVRERFVEAFDGVEVRRCLPGLNSKKVAEVAPARVHGLEDNVKRLKNSPVMNELVGHPEWMPLIFDEDGAELPFPLPDQPVPAMKPRSRRRSELGEGEGPASGAPRGGHGRKEGGGGRSWKGQSQSGQLW